MPIHERDQVKKTPPLREIRDVGAPDQVRAVDRQALQQVGTRLPSLRRPAGVRIPVDRHQAHQPHQTPHALRVHRLVLVPKVPSHPPDPEEWRLHELPVDQGHQAEVLGRQALERVANGDVDFALSPCVDAARIPSVNLEYLFTEQMVILVPNNHSLSRISQPTLAEIAAYPIISMPAQAAIHANVPCFCRRRAHVLTV